MIHIELSVSLIQMNWRWPMFGGPEMDMNTSGRHVAPLCGYYWFFDKNTFQLVHWGGFTKICLWKLCGRKHILTEALACVLDTIPDCNTY